MTNPFTAGGIGNIKVETELKVETHSPLDHELEMASHICGNESRSSFNSTKQLSHPIEAPSAPRFSRVNWEAGAPQATTEPISRSDDGVRSGYQATAFSTNQSGSAEANPPRSTSLSHHNPNRRRTAAMEGNAAAWGYFKVAFLMFAALIIVWVPSTVNRLQQLINKDKAIFGLNLASALVLPLQGFWNSMIYTSTTWPECKRAFTETLDAISSGRRARRTSYGRNSDHTLTGSETNEFESTVPLDAVMSKSESQRHLQSRMSSAETMRAPVTHPEK